MTETNESITPLKSWRMIKCPKCGSEYNHIGKPILRESNDERGSAWEGNGDAIVIPMECEQGCSWKLIIGFHKGNTYLVYEDWIPK